MLVAGSKPISAAADMPAPAEAAPVEPEGEEAGLQDAAGQAFEAVKNGDRAAFASAFEDAVRICMRKYA